MSVREKIIQEVYRKLAGIGCTVELRRLSEATDRELPMLVIEVNPAQAENASGGTLAHTLPLQIGAVTGGHDAEEAAGEIIIAALEIIGKNTTWSDLATDTTLGQISEQKAQPGHVRYVLAATIAIRYETGLWSL